VEQSDVQVEITLKWGKKELEKYLQSFSVE
jgi:hypothetical protein